MNEPVSRGNCLGQYKWGNDCYGWNFVNSDSISIKQELMPPDTAEQLHYHQKATQFFFILKGTAIMTIDGEETLLKPLQGIAIKPLQKHCISNKGGADLEFILYSHPSTNGDRINCEG
ncbi:cupin domain-containing protein [Mucilaginibacter sp.]